jgi:hypothetical protein
MPKWTLPHESLSTGKPSRERAYEDRLTTNQHLIIGEDTTLKCLKMATRATRRRLAILTLSACGFVLLMAMPWAGAFVRQAAPASTPTQTYEGMITDTHCGAKHDPSIARSATDCVRVCVHGGAQFALVSGENLYILHGDPAVLKRLAGERARVFGTLKGKTITVASAAS